MSVQSTMSAVTEKIIARSKTSRRNYLARIEAAGSSQPARKALVIPAELATVLKNDEVATEQWEKFNYTHKKEYVEWITDAKQDETRKRRVAQALEMIREGVCKEDKHRV